jgi:hypothetical protein
LGADGRCAFAIVTLYCFTFGAAVAFGFFTFEAVAASAICGIRDVIKTATTGTNIDRIFI